MKFFVKDFCETVKARVVIFGMWVGNDVSSIGCHSGDARPETKFFFCLLGRGRPQR